MARASIGIVMGAILVGLAPLQPAPAGSVTLEPAQDNTLYGPDGTVSGGQALCLFAGRTSGTALRRTLLTFDVAASVPAGAVIDSATLTLHVSMSPPGNTNPQTVALHRVLAEWGESTSGAGVCAGGGAAATGDATWTHRFFSTDLWATVGGDFAVAPSASLVVPWTNDGFATWGSTISMVGDVQDWLDNPTGNFGWILVGNEAATQSVRRFDSRESADPALRPELVVTFTPKAAGSAAVPNGDDVPGNPLTLSKLLSGELGLAWAASCLATDTDYEIYEGLLGSFSTHVPVQCSTGGVTSATFVPMEASAYYLVVPRNAAAEGSYGTASGGIERGQGAASCLPQVVVDCR